MAFQFQFGVLGEAQIDRTLASYSEALDDMRPAWNELADRFANAEKKQFATEGAYGGDAWSPLSPAYAEWKQRHYGSMPILQREQDMYVQLTQQPFGVDVRELHYALFGTALPYAVFHQNGTKVSSAQRNLGSNLSSAFGLTAGSRGIGLPQRRVVVLTEYEKRSWVKVIQKHLHDAVKKRIEQNFPLTKLIVKDNAKRK